MPVTRPLRMKEIGGASGDVPTRTIPTVGAGACRGGGGGPHADSIATASRMAARIAARLMSTSSPLGPGSALERELDSLGGRLQLHALVRRVERDPDVVPVLHAGDPLAAADRPGRLDRGVGAVEIVQVVQVVNV